MNSPTAVGGWIGKALVRAEDDRFLKGEARFVGDLKLPAMLHAAFVRSVYAHGRLRGIDSEATKAAPGVRAVVTGADLVGETDPFPIFGRDADLVPVTHPLLARDRVRYVGEPVALVVADTPEQAVDAAELMIVDVEELPALIDPREAQAAPPLHDDAPDNVILRARFGSGEVDTAFAQADAIVRQTVRIPRLIAAPLEPRAVLASYDRESDLLTLWLSAQDHHRQLDGLSKVLRRPPDKLHVLVPDVGGAFGSKGVPQAETAVIALAAVRLGRAIQWIETRTENSLAVYQGRGVEVDAELALAGDGRMLGLRARVLADLGAYLYSTTPVSSQTLASLLVGCYAIPAAEVEVTGVCTTKVPTGPYRGAGRPEAALTIERLVDCAAAELGFDRIEIRRRNVIPHESFPYQSPLGVTYDSGDYAGALDAALELSRWDDLLAERDRLRAAGHVAGAGVALYVERAGPGWETARLRLEANGSVVLFTGCSPHGQGHETTFAQMVAEELGGTPETVEVRWGDSFEIPEGVGTFASRSVTVGGSAALLAARDLRVRLNKGEIAPLEVSTRFELPGPVFSFGAYVAAVEIERETGETHLKTLVAVDDCGRVANPLLAEGQVRGAVVQAIGECFHEYVGHDDDGQPLAVNLYDYHLPTARSLPELLTVLRETPSPFNPLGAKGIGEGGSIGTPAAVANAVADALTPLGTRHLDPPYTASRVWEAIRAVAPSLSSASRKEAGSTGRS